MSTISPTDRAPDPGWVAVASAVDMPPLDLLIYRVFTGRAAVVEVDGRPMVLESSPLVPHGQVFVFNRAALSPIGVPW